MKFVAKQEVKANAGRIHEDASTMQELDRQTKVRTNASAGLSPELETALNEAATHLQQVAAGLAQHLEGQITTPEFTGGDDVAASRLIDWTADIFAIAEDIKFYLNPPKETK